MSKSVDKLNLTPEIYTQELIPTLREWRSLLNDRGVNSHFWFMFGSVVKQADIPVDSQDPVRALASELLGVRGPNSHPFRPTSDLDVGVVVDDGHDDIDLHKYEPDSPFRTAKAGGHVLSLTRFTVSWMDRRGVNIEEKGDKPVTLGMYGLIVPVEL